MSTADSNTTGGRKKGRRPGKHVIKAPVDGHTKKHTSPGMQAVICAIQESWNGPTGQEKFAKDFAPFVRGMAAIYRGNARSKADRSEDGVQKFVDRIAEGKQDIAFHEQRAFAAYLGQIPVGLLMLYTQMVSDASRLDTKEDIIGLLESFSEAIETLRKWLSNGDVVGLLIDREPVTKDGHSEFKACIEGLRLACATFAARRKNYFEKQAVRKSSST